MQSENMEAYLIALIIISFALIYQKGWLGITSRSLRFGMKVLYTLVLLTLSLLLILVVTSCQASGYQKTSWTIGNRISRQCQSDSARVISHHKWYIISEQNWKVLQQCLEDGEYLYHAISKEELQMTDSLYLPRKKENSSRKLLTR